jgi:hypothetical protein
MKRVSISLVLGNWKNCENNWTALSILFFQFSSYDVVTILVSDASESQDQISEISKVKIQGQGYLEII